MIRSTCLAALALLALGAPSAAVADRAAARAVTTARPSAAETAAWRCGDGRCNYRKVQGGGWSDCFTAWSPTHGGWLPTRYCR